MKTTDTTATSITANRRAALRNGTAVSAALLSAAATPKGLHAAGTADDDPKRIIKIALVGCGGRGTGAINDSLTINENVRLVALADVDRNNCERTLAAMSRRHGEKVDVTASRIHVGLDAHEQVNSDPEVDLVLIASPPGFHPSHMSRAVKAGKHVFCEKPSCVDVAGYQACVATHDEAVKNRTAIVSGTQYRRQVNYVGAIEQIRDGLIGDVISAKSRYCSTGIWFKNRKEGMTDAQYQIYNWMHFTWLAGDQICEQAVHNIDTINWVMGASPISAYGSGGRFTRPEGSEMWDSMSIDYEYPGNRTLSFTCRQIPGTKGDNGNVIYGTKGIVTIDSGSGGSRILDRDGNELWSLEGSIAAAYRQGHTDLVDSIREGNPIIELKQTAESSRTAGMGRLAAYTGQIVTWDFMTQESKLDLFPKHLAWSTVLPEPSYAIPGQTKLV